MLRFLEGLGAIALGMAMMSAAAVAGDVGEDFSARKHIVVVASPTMGRFIDSSFKNALPEGALPKPRVDFHDSATVFERFCGGIGVDSPDMAASIRRMSRLEFRRCGDNAVGGVIEIVLGYEVAALFSKVESLPISLTGEQVYRGLAKDVPLNGEFKPNPYKTWRDVDHSLPNVEIRVIITGRGTPWRSLFDDKVLQSGCRHVAETRAIYDAKERVGRCVTLRGDGRVIEVASPAAVMTALDAQPPGAVALIPPDVAKAFRNRIQPVAIDGMMLAAEDVDSGEYPLSRRLFYYFKVNHMRDRKGYGIALNLRDFMTYAVDEPKIGSGGDLTRIGLVPLPPEQRASQRRAVALLRPMDR
jgi:phosphate transport system substrate-binding protein